MQYHNKNCIKYTLYNKFMNISIVKLLLFCTKFVILHKLTHFTYPVGYDIIITVKEIRQKTKYIISLILIITERGEKVNRKNHSFVSYDGLIKQVTEKICIESP